MNPPTETCRRLPSTEWLEEFLSTGPKTIEQVRIASRNQRFQWPTICRAKVMILAYSPKPGTWALPGKEQQP
jgi:hypothetical protein